MGRKGSSKSSGSGTLALQTDSEGNLRYDMILHQNQRDGKVIHSRARDLQEKDISVEDDRARPSEEEVNAITKKTRAAIEKLTDSLVLGRGGCDSLASSNYSFF